MPRNYFFCYSTYCTYCAHCWTSKWKQLWLLYCWAHRPYTHPSFKLWYAPYHTVVMNCICTDLSVGNNTYCLYYPLLCQLVLTYRSQYITYSMYSTLGWVNLSEFEITVCGSCKMSRKNNMTIFNFLKTLLFCKNP